MEHIHAVFPLFTRANSATINWTYHEIAGALSVTAGSTVPKNAQNGPEMAGLNSRPLGRPLRGPLKIWGIALS